jgi:hypothetical protein
MCARLCVGFAVDMRMDNRNTVNNVAMVKETDVRIVKCEYHNQNATDYISISL